MAAYMSKLIPKTINIQILALKKKRDTPWGNLFNLERMLLSSPDALFCPKSKTKEKPMRLHLN